MWSLRTKNKVLILVGINSINVRDKDRSIVKPSLIVLWTVLRSTKLVAVEHAFA